MIEHLPGMQDILGSILNTNTNTPPPFKIPFNPAFLFYKAEIQVIYIKYILEKSASITLEKHCLGGR